MHQQKTLSCNTMFFNVDVNLPSNNKSHITALKKELWAYMYAPTQILRKLYNHEVILVRNNNAIF